MRLGPPRPVGPPLLVPLCGPDCTLIMDPGPLGPQIPGSTVLSQSAQTGSGRPRRWVSGASAFSPAPSLESMSAKWGACGQGGVSRAPSPPGTHLWPRTGRGAASKTGPGGPHGHRSGPAACGCPCPAGPPAAWCTGQAGRPGPFAPAPARGHPWRGGPGSGVTRGGDPGSGSRVTRGGPRLRPVALATPGLSCVL